MDRLHFVVGDVRETIARVGKSWDMIFVISPSENGFAQYYTTKLFPTLKPETPVMVAGM